MTLRPDYIKGAIVSRLKAQATIVAELDSSAEIKEAQWQGRDFKYPAIRVSVSPIDPMQPDCNRWEVPFVIATFSEEASSYQADKISGIIHGVLHGKSFSQSIEGQDLRFSLWTNTLVPAIRQDDRTWRSENLMRATVSG